MTEVSFKIVFPGLPSTNDAAPDLHSKRFKHFNLLHLIFTHCFYFISALSSVFVFIIINYIFSNLLIRIPRNFIPTLTCSAHLSHLVPLLRVLISFMLLKIFNFFFFFFAHSNETLNMLLIFLDLFNFSSTVPSTSSYSFSQKHHSNFKPVTTLCTLSHQFSFFSCLFIVLCSSQTFNRRFKYL